ncbi:MAG TPA: Na/Pi cotransporter family protein, partial [Spirochaetes bacterium]|nr:Na/Pi cotransporter family protein [Spirochaetota bacterium]
DHCENLLRLLRRKYEGKISFSETAVNEIMEISSKVREFLTLLIESYSPGQVNILPHAEAIEERIDEMRRSMRTRHVERLCTSTCDVPSGLIFIDMLNNFEKIGDHALNIAQIISGKRIF